MYALNVDRRCCIVPPLKDADRGTIENYPPAPTPTYCKIHPYLVVRGLSAPPQELLSALAVSAPPSRNPAPSSGCPLTPPLIVSRKPIRLWLNARGVVKYRCWICQRLQVWLMTNRKSHLGPFTVTLNKGSGPQIWGNRKQEGQIWRIGNYEQDLRPRAKYFSLGVVGG